MGDRTNAERQRRYIARLKARAVEGVTSAPDTAEVAALAQKLAQAEQQVAAAKARILNLEDEIAALRGALAHERKRHAAKPKAEKPAPTPDEARDRQIKALKTRMRNIMSELHAAREWRRGGLDGGMSFQTMSAIAKPLAADHRKRLTGCTKLARPNSRGAAPTGCGRRSSSSSCRTRPIARISAAGPP